MHIRKSDLNVLQSMGELWVKGPSDFFYLHSPWKDEQHKYGYCMKYIETCCSCVQSSRVKIKVPMHTSGLL